MDYLGNYAAGQPVYCFWDSFDSTGASLAPSVAGQVRVYKDNSTTEDTAGVTDTRNFDTVTGIHLATISTLGAFYASGHDYAIILQGSTLDGRTVSKVLGAFSIGNRV